MWAPWSVGPACQRETSCSARPNIEAEKEAEAEAEADCLLAGVQFSRRIPSLVAATYAIPSSGATPVIFMCILVHSCVHLIWYQQEVEVFG
uniref:Uncharacterized protein n=1 Tax=Oryza meridionalis TaxID=40149 RepID=A0A0E0F2W2_9ORYZ